MVVLVEPEKVDLRKTQGFLAVMSSILVEKAIVKIVWQVVAVNVLGVAKESVLVQGLAVVVLVLVVQVAESEAEAENGDGVEAVKEECVPGAEVEAENEEGAEKGMIRFLKVKKRFVLKIENAGEVGPVNVDAADPEIARVEAADEAEVENAGVLVNVAEPERNSSQMLGTFRHLQFLVMTMRVAALCLEKSNRNQSILAMTCTQAFP